MIRKLKAFVEWLDKRYPPKIRYTQEVADHVKERLHVHGRGLDSLRLRLDTVEVAHAERIAELEKAFGALKESVVKGEITPKAEAVKLRESFIAGNFGRGS